MTSNGVSYQEQPILHHKNAVKIYEIVTLLLVIFRN